MPLPPPPPDLLLVRRRYADKPACLGDLATQASASLGLDQPAILQAVMRREALGSTGVGGGIALPHARLPTFDAPFVVFACLKDPIGFDAVDGRPVDIVCLLLLPNKSAATDLALLSSWARLLRDKGVATSVRGARTEEALRHVLSCRQERP